MKKAYFFIDDVIWLFRDLTRQRPASLFDNFFLKELKKAHDLYGAKFQLNVFYRTDFYYGNDEFTLADMTDAYKQEFEAASDWLKMAVHSKQEFPDYPFVNMNYQDALQIMQTVMGEIRRFAGEKSLTYTITPHWGPASLEACRAFKDCGMKLIWASHGDVMPYDGDVNSLPYGHAGRLLNNRKPETMLFTRRTLDTAIAKSICCHNHMDEAEGEATLSTYYNHLDPVTGLYFKVLCSTYAINLIPADEIDKHVLECMDKEFVCLATHEQYSYPDYFAYQPEHFTKILRACQLVHEHGYPFIFADELVD